jgi:hypothetical protein
MKHLRTLCGLTFALIAASRAARRAEWKASVNNARSGIQRLQELSRHAL